LSDEIEKVVIGDYDIDKANKLVENIGLEKVSAVKVDANQADEIRNVISGCDIVVNCVGPFYRTVKTILRVAIEEGVDYVDVWDDVSVVDEIFGMDAAAKEAGITAIIGLGFSPGVTNMMAALAAARLLDETESIDIYHTHGGEPEEGPGVIAHRFHCMSVDCPMFLDGELKTVRFFEDEGIALRERVDFLGLEKGIEVYPYPHPEQVTLPKHFNVRQVTNKGSVLPAEYYELTMEMCRLGLNSTEPVNVNGNSVLPHDFAIAYLMRERDQILEEKDFGAQRGSSMVAVRGKKDGLAKSCYFKAFSIGGKHSGLGVATGVPAAVGAVLLHRNKVPQKGVYSPEGCVDPADFFPLWEELTSLVTDRKKPFDLIVEIVDEKGDRKESELSELI